MMNGIVQPVNDANEVSRRTLQPYQSLWLAHWKRTDSDAGGDSRSEEPCYSARKDGLSKGVEASSRPANGFGSIRNRTLEVGYNFTKIGRKSVGSDSKEPDEFDIEADKFDKGKEAAVSDGSRRRSADMRTLEHEQCCERTVVLPSQSDHSSDECLRESGSCDHCLSTINNAWFSKMQKCSGIRLSPSQSNSSEENELMKSRIDCYSKLKLQKCDHGLGAARMCSSVDVPGRSSAEFPRFSQSNTDLLITNKTSVDAFKENDTFRSRRAISNIDGNLSSAVHSILPFFGQNKHKVQLKSLSSSDDSKVKEYMRDSKASKVTIRNNLPSETDTVEMDSVKEKQYKKNLYSASNSTSSTKALLPSQAFNMESNEAVFPRKVQNTCPTSTKSLTMDNEKLLENFHHPIAKSDPNQEDCQNGNRWVKRLKLSSSNYSIQGETTPNDVSTTPRDRTSKLFNGIPRSNATKTIPNLKRHHNERSDVTNEEDRFPKSSNDKAKALLLSHAWVQRWLRSGGRETKRESSRLAVKKVEGEHLPSIAAMALMAKVLTCFQECELQKRGSYTVWNTKTV